MILSNPFEKKISNYIDSQWQEALIVEFGFIITATFMLTIILSKLVNITKVDI